MPAGYVQEKFESIPGNELNTPTLSTKVLYAPWREFEVDPDPSHFDRGDELSASEEPRALTPERYEPTWNGRSAMYPDTLGFRLKHIVGAPVTTVGDGVITDPDGNTVPVGAFMHVWDSTHANWGNPGASPLTTQAIAAFKDQGQFYKLKGAACDDLSLTTPETGGAEIAASGPALYCKDDLSDPSLTPAFESSSVLPFNRGGLQLVTWLSGSGTHEDFDFRIAAPVDAVGSLGIESKWRDVMEKGEGLIVVTGSLAQRQLDPQDVAALRAATGFPIKARWKSDSVIGVTSYNNRFWLEGANAQYMSGGRATLANRRRIGSSFDFRLSAAASGAAAKLTLVNGTSSYA